MMQMIFFLDWITDYYKTPKIQLTRDQEILGIIGIAIVATLLLGMLCFVAAILYKIKKTIDGILKKNRKDETSRAEKR